jgi:phosphomannomutase/phosphoglucomutase
MDYSIFRSYDIRGVYGKNLTDGMMEKIGNLICQYSEKKDFVVARDGRLSSPALSEALIRGVRKAGGNVIDVGINPLGSGFFHAWKTGRVFLYVTGSHLGKEHNGVKLFRPNGEGFREEEIMRIRDMYREGRFVEKREGRLEFVENSKVIDDYIDYLLSRIRPKRGMKVILDCGNGAASLIAGELFEKAGFEVKVLFGELDGNFPNRQPDPMKDPMEKMKSEISGYDMGIGYDGDGDRITPMDDKGRKLEPEQTSYVILSDVLKKEKGPVIANVECTRILDDIANRFGRKVERIKVGHTFLAEFIHKLDGAFGVERSGHFMLPSLIPYDDSLAISYYMACILSSQDKKLSEIVDGIKSSPFDRDGFECSDEVKFRVVENLQKRFSEEFDRVNTMDGVRIDFPDGWVLIRASNTSPKIRITVEADNMERLREIKEKFATALKKEIGSLKG